MAGDRLSCRRLLYDPYVAVQYLADHGPSGVSRSGHRYLLWASLLAIACAILCSFVLTRKVLRSLSQMTESTRDLACGEYTQRVQIASQDEVGQLGEAFNRMADSLRRIEQLRRHMVSDVAHEWRTPLTTMRGYLEDLRDQVIDSGAETFDMLHEETLRLVKLSEDLLELTLAQSGCACEHSPRTVRSY